MNVFSALCTLAWGAVSGVASPAEEGAGEEASSEYTLPAKPTQRPFQWEVGAGVRWTLVFESNREVPSALTAEFGGGIRLQNWGVTVRGAVATATSSEVSFGGVRVGVLHSRTPVELEAFWEWTHAQHGLRLGAGPYVGVDSTQLRGPLHDRTTLFVAPGVFVRAAYRRSIGAIGFFMAAAVEVPLTRDTLVIEGIPLTLKTPHLYVVPLLLGLDLHL